MPGPNIFAVACTVCDSALKVNRQRFETSKSFACSKPCLAELRRRNTIAYKGSAETRAATCPVCSRGFTRKPSQIAKYKSNYCSRDCRAIGIQGPNLALVTGNHFPCETCGKQVWRTPATLRPHVYCSKACAGKGPRSLRKKRVCKPCANCGTTMRMLPSEAKRYRFCSWRCAAKTVQGAKRGLPGKPWTPEQKSMLSETLLRKYRAEWSWRPSVQSERMKGERNPRWRDGRARRPYARGFTDALKERIAKRDSRRCRRCGIPRQPGTHVVHHIDGGKHNHHPSNLVLLCRPCHGQVHAHMDRLVTRR